MPWNPDKYSAFKRLIMFAVFWQAQGKHNVNYQPGLFTMFK